MRNLRATYSLTGLWLITVCAVLAGADSAVTQRLAAGWKPTHSAAAQAYLDAYYRDRADAPLDPARVVTQPSGLGHRDIHTIINDRTLGERFFEIHADLMHPTRSVYIDPIFGAFTGQSAIRAWLVPTMSQIKGVAFDAVRPAEFFDDGEGGTSVDEWQVHSLIDGEWVPSIRGVSVRRYRDGWIEYAADHFDSTPARMASTGGTPLPPWPRVATQPWTGEPPRMSAAARAYVESRRKTWDRFEVGSPERDVMQPSGLSNAELHGLLFDPESGSDVRLIADLMHPTESEYHDPIFASLKGQRAIRAWYIDIMTKTGNIVFESLSPPLFNGATSFQEFRQMAVLPDGERLFMVRGASVRRYADGFIVYAQDYFDTAPLSDPGIQAASAAAGSTLTLQDVLRYRPELAAPADQPTPR
ncbi:MAG: hypothetical protein HC809_02625 [Gammaproteobacteria bacterium]|nr:hypothetical protein [Gammaproteobacteria bacterium]